MTATIKIQPGDSLSIEVAGLGILYSVYTEKHEFEVGVSVVDDSNGTTLDENTHEIIYDDDACVNCGVRTFVVDDPSMGRDLVGERLHVGHEGLSCGTLSPDTVAEVDTPDRTANGLITGAGGSTLKVRATFTIHVPGNIKEPDAHDVLTYLQETVVEDADASDLWTVTDVSVEGWR